MIYLWAGNFSISMLFGYAHPEIERKSSGIDFRVNNDLDKHATASNDSVSLLKAVQAKD